MTPAPAEEQPFEPWKDWIEGSALRPFPSLSGRSGTALGIERQIVERTRKCQDPSLTNEKQFTEEQNSTWIVQSHDAFRSQRVFGKPHRWDLAPVPSPIAPPARRERGARARPRSTTIGAIPPLSRRLGGRWERGPGG